MLTAADELLAPLLSYAIALIAYVPAATDDQVNVYGAAVSVLSSVVPLRTKVWFSSNPVWAT